MKQDRTPEIEAHLQKLLDLVGIGYLVSRWGGDAEGAVVKDHKGWDHVATWEVSYCLMSGCMQLQL